PLNKEKPPISEYAIKLWATNLLVTGGAGRRQRSDASLKRDDDFVFAKNGEALDRLSPPERLAGLAGAAVLFFAGERRGWQFDGSTTASPAARSMSFSRRCSRPGASRPTSIITLGRR